MPFALAGENVKMRVKNIEEHDISRGDMICNNLNYCQESAELKANVTVLELPQEKKLLSSGYECILHMHAIAAQVEISKVQKIDKESQKLTKIAFLIAGDKGVCHIKVLFTLSRSKDLFAFKNSNSCLPLAGSPSVTKISNYQ